MVLNTKPTVPVKDTGLSEEIERNLRNLPDSQLYRMIYIEPGRCSAAELAAARREMDRRAVSFKIVSGSRSDNPADKRKGSSSRKKYSFWSAEYQAFYFAAMGLAYIAFALIYHWVTHQAIRSRDIFQAIFRLCISAAIYLYLVFRTKPSRRRG